MKIIITVCALVFANMAQADEADIGRYVVAAGDKKSVGPVTSLALPASWLDDDGTAELVIFDEHGAAPTRCKVVRTVCPSCAVPVTTSGVKTKCPIIKSKCPAGVCVLPRATVRPTATVCPPKATRCPKCLIPPPR